MLRQTMSRTLWMIPIKNICSRITRYFVTLKTRNPFMIPIWDVEVWLGEFRLFISVDVLERDGTKASDFDKLSSRDLKESSKTKKRKEEEKFPRNFICLILPWDWLDIDSWTFWGFFISSFCYRNCGGNMFGRVCSKRWGPLKCWLPYFSPLWRWFKRPLQASTNDSSCRHLSNFSNICSRPLSATETISLIFFSEWYSLRRNRFRRQLHCLKTCT